MLRQWIDRLRSRERRVRTERFGAIVQLGWPRVLVFVDRVYARRLGVRARSGEWDDDEPALGAVPLRAPLEAHLQLTNRCGAGCKGCYTGATALGAPNEWGLEQWKRGIDELAKMGVFHLALGGGESATLPYLGDVARYARERGLIPNLTTSGLEGLDELLPIASLFGQINVSLDGIGATYAAVRGFDGFERATHALRELRRRVSTVGINVVVTRQSFGDLDELFSLARAYRLNEIELLRFKPSGRGAAVYQQLVCTQQQHREFLPTVLALARKHRVRVRVDCSYTPMIAHHDPGPELLSQLAVYGCTGGDFLIGVKADGAVSACSFAAAPVSRPDLTEIATYWQEPEAFPAFRNWQQADEPCRSCTYLSLCRGGCRVVSRHRAGSASAPDPECPRVVDHTTERRSPVHLPVLPTAVRTVLR